MRPGPRPFTEESARPAPLWRRLAAIIYDSFLVLAIWMLVGFVVFWLFGVDTLRTAEGEAVRMQPAAVWTLRAALVMSAVGFFTLFWTKSGQTLGMQAWKIRVQNPDGSPISLRQCLLRCALAPLSFLCFGLGYVYLYLDPQGRTLHDCLSDSQVVVLKSRASRD